MRPLFKFTVGAVLAAFTLSALAQTTPTYKTTNASGSTAATCYFAGDPGKAVRVIGAIATSDKAGSVLSCRKGEGAYAIKTANATTTAVNVMLTTTATNIADSAVVVLQKTTGACYSGIVSGTATNCIILTSGGFGAAQAVGDEVYVMSDAVTLPVGNASVNYQGQALFTADRGRPVRVVLDGTSACAISSLSCVYE